MSEVKNPVIVNILRKEYSDYDENEWHYDRQYKMLCEAFNSRQTEIDNFKKEVIRIWSDGKLLVYLRDKGHISSEYDNIDLKGFYIEYLNDDEHHDKIRKEKQKNK